jgi:hypothetical protein
MAELSEPQHASAGIRAGVWLKPPEVHTRLKQLLLVLVLLLLLVGV